MTNIESAIATCKDFANRKWYNKIISYLCDQLNIYNNPEYSFCGDLFYYLGISHCELGRIDIASLEILDEEQIIEQLNRVSYHRKESRRAYYTAISVNPLHIANHYCLAYLVHEHATQKHALNKWTGNINSRKNIFVRAKFNVNWEDDARQAILLSNNVIDMCNSTSTIYCAKCFNYKAYDTGLMILNKKSSENISDIIQIANDCVHFYKQCIEYHYNDINLATFKICRDTNLLCASIYINYYIDRFVWNILNCTTCDPCDNIGFIKKFLWNNVRYIIGRALQNNVESFISDNKVAMDFTNDNDLTLYRSFVETVFNDDKHLTYIYGVMTIRPAVIPDFYLLLYLLSVLSNNVVLEYLEVAIHQYNSIVNWNPKATESIKSKICLCYLLHGDFELASNFLTYNKYCYIHSANHVSYMACRLTDSTGNTDLLRRFISECQLSYLSALNRINKTNVLYYVNKYNIECSKEIIEAIASD